MGGGGHWASSQNGENFKEKAFSPQGTLAVKMRILHGRKEGVTASIFFLSTGQCGAAYRRGKKSGTCKRVRLGLPFTAFLSKLCLRGKK